MVILLISLLGIITVVGLIALLVSLLGIVPGVVVLIAVLGIAVLALLIPLLLIGLAVVAGLIAHGTVLRLIGGHILIPGLGHGFLCGFGDYTVGNRFRGSGHGGYFGLRGNFCRGGFCRKDIFCGSARGGASVHDNIHKLILAVFGKGLYALQFGDLPEVIQTFFLKHFSCHRSKNSFRWVLYYKFKIYRIGFTLP